MTPEQALQVLAQATAQLNANREAHMAILKALEVLKEEINKNGSN